MGEYARVLVAVHCAGVGCDLPITEEVAETRVRLPIHNRMSDAEQTAVIRAAISFG